MGKGKSWGGEKIEKNCEKKINKTVKLMKILDKDYIRNKEWKL